MNKLSLFWRLYLSMSLSILLLSVALITIMQAYLGYDGSRDFAQDVLRETALVVRQLEQGEIDSAQLDQFRQDGFFELSIRGNDDLLERVDELDSYEGMHIGSLPDGRMQAWIAIPGRQFTLLVEDPLDFEAMHLSEEMSEEDYVENNAYVFLIVLTLLVMSVVVFLIAKSLEKPIESLQQTQLKFARGEQGVRANENVVSPLDGLAKNFNTMATQIQTQIKDQQVMTHAIAHELRTPLARMQMALGILSAKHEDYSEPQQALLSDLDGYIEEMDKLTNTVLTLGKVQQQDMSDLATIDADRLVQQRIGALDKGEKQFLVDLQSQAMLKMLPMHLQLLVDNLVKNAQRYGDKQVCVVSYIDKGEFVFSVSDDGEGIDENKRQEIFTAFARLDNSRSRETGGFGLGLAIVDSIVRRYQGGISVERSELGGARFVCRFAVG